MNDHPRDVPPTGRLEQGFVQVYTGDGKGKTTAAIGLAVRAMGAGLRVYIGQFIKAGDSNEIEALRRFGGLITMRQFGRGCWLHGEPDPADVAAARIGLREIRLAVTSGDYDLVILDEANPATWFKLIDVQDFLDLIDLKPPHVELVFTGRRADPRLLERADLVTEMVERKHYFSSGISARQGIER
ncbi:cob(I)yrinic acid a,c-diamide adenosyltransferase [bacterium]|nr:cob(I)yrinic acid a,c-diamide adenosyltransferase [candidate division CSSED10-310 bacterium]